MQSFPAATRWLCFVSMHDTACDARLACSQDFEFGLCSGGIRTRNKRDRQPLVGVFPYTSVVQLLDRPCGCVPDGLDRDCSARKMVVALEYGRVIAGECLYAQAAPQA